MAISSNPVAAAFFNLITAPVVFSISKVLYPAYACGVIVPTPIFPEVS